MTERKVEHAALESKERGRQPLAKSPLGGTAEVPAGDVVVAGRGVTPSARADSAGSSTGFGSAARMTLPRVQINRSYPVKLLVGATKNVRIPWSLPGHFALRTNMPSFGKRTPFGKQHLAPFEQKFEAIVGGRLRANAEPENLDFAFTDDSKEQTEDSPERTIENSRLRNFTRDYIRDTKGDSLDISWLKDKDSIDAADLPEPDVLAAEAMTELTEALRELDSLMTALGASDQAKVQKDLLADALGLADEGAQ